MKQIFLVLEGNIPSKKNSKRIVYNRKTHKPMVISTKKYYEWERFNILKVKQISAETGTLEATPVYVYITLYRKDKRRFDWNNISQAITDILVKGGLLKDDSAYYCKPVFQEFYIDRINPRAEIIVTDKYIQEG